MRTTTLALAMAVLLAPLAGCLGPDEPAETDATDETSRSATNESAGLSAPPTWEPGDWWEITFTDPTPAADGATYTTTRVVAGTAGDAYRVGMPPEAFSDRILVWHMPGFGAVQRSDLGYLVHGEHFHALDFPLEEGKTWEATFIQDMTAEVVSVEDGQAAVEFTAPVGPEENYTAMELVYDAREGHIAQLTSHPHPALGTTASHGSYEVVDHGEDYEGSVQVPEDRREVFFQGRRAGVTGFSSLAAPPQGSVEVPEDVDRVTLAHVLGEAQSHTPTSGHYQVTTTTPGGQTVEDQLMPGSAPGRHVDYYGIWDAAGTWSFEHVAAGAGATLAEGIGYGVNNVTLPGS